MGSAGCGQSFAEIARRASPAVALAAWLARRSGSAGALFVGMAPGREPERLSGAGLYHVVRTLGWRVGMRFVAT